MSEPYRSEGPGTVYGTGGTLPPPPPPPPPIGAPTPPLGPSQGTVYQKAGGQHNILGWIGLACGIIGTGCCCCPWLNGAPFIGGIPAVILGAMHLNKVKKGAASMAWLGWVAIALGVLAMIAAICGIATGWQDRVFDQYQQFR
ncbi:hypothetical protein GCM10009679_22360 [Saccharothrix algeriensis]|uniref:DUF4190 domain-containing protein n=1 Tax=Catellatospora bangladeshensis TaxID=310355 RepID=A0A8J3JEW6_9ACTN|nr:hypothetical protein Cba03nite_06010 [Catellatospora bangladeshensis]